MARRSAQDKHARVFCTVPTACAEPMHPARIARLWPLRWRVRLRQACVPAAVLGQAADEPANPQRQMRRCGRGLVYVSTTTRHTAPGLQERDELALGLGIPLDVALCHGQAGMAREFLHVPETPADLRDFARSAGNEGAAAGMRRTAVHLERRIEPMKP